jgi:hypothetical protein
METNNVCTICIDYIIFYYVLVAMFISKGERTGVKVLLSFSPHLCLTCNIRPPFHHDVRVHATNINCLPERQTEDGTRPPSPLTRIAILEESTHKSEE